MGNARTVVIVLSFVVAAGCSGSQIRENMSRGVYDGANLENMRGTTPAENAGKPEMNYDQYRQQRKELLKRE